MRSTNSPNWSTRSRRSRRTRKTSNTTGVASLIRAGLMAAFGGSWVPFAGYMMVIMVISFVASRMAPETVDRGLSLVEDARVAPPSGGR